MKKIFLLFLLISALSHAQYTVKGTMQPTEKSLWVLLYKVEGTKQVFVQNTKIKKDGSVGLFEFTLPVDAKIGAYRILYNMKKNGFIDFLFNKENIEFEFNPKDQINTLVYKKSNENQIYTSYLKDISAAQFKIDSLQNIYFKKKNELTKKDYKTWLQKLQKIEIDYKQKSQGALVNNFIEATERYNSPEILKTPREYINSSINHFFDHIDFSSKILYNSSFLLDRISDYIFYINYSQDPEKQQDLYKKSSKTVIDKINKLSFKADVIEFLISQFAAIKNAEIVDYLFSEYFDLLPKENQNLIFKEKIIAELTIAIGRVAPDFSWTENGKKQRLSTLKEGKNYLLIFYSTECSHCLREVPQVFEFLKDKPNTKVIAFAMETSEKKWLEYQKEMPGWHHVIGLKKWENEIAKTYQINATPSYFVLGTTKKIISIPQRIEDLKLVLEEIN